MKHEKMGESIFLQQVFNFTFGRYVVAILFVWGMVTGTIEWNPVYATDCNSDCEGHFKKPWQKPDLVRCRTERAIACKTGWENCDLLKYEPGRISITKVIQRLHDTKNNPSDEAACYKDIDLGSLGETIGEGGHTLYQIATETASTAANFSVAGTIIGAAIKEGVKQVLRCSCKAVNWNTKTTGTSPTMVGNWSGSPGCPIVFTHDDGQTVDGNCNNGGFHHLIHGTYASGDTINITVTRIDLSNNCSTSVPGNIHIHDNNHVTFSQEGWNGCGVKTGPGSQEWHR